MSKELTERQESILNFIKQFVQKTGYPPTLREIGKHFGISSTFGVKRHLEALVKKGFLNIESNASRGIALVRNDADFENPFSTAQDDVFIKLPVVGRVAAGSPILAIENIESSMLIDSSYLKNSEDAFALRVQGDSMINAGIKEGDLVIVSPKENTKNGDIIVAMLDDEATVKRLQVNGKEISLIPENENYTPIVVNNK
ncbi:MAG: transcriptional repressor LexA, partial [Ignavibacteriaceae bacterium]|nr:transcriptional repressor LexA [Ignavibacteria bacterium]NNL22335.1 transcriptional repressor LexA [Ignavibacteriaceae bacterium]